LPPPRTLLVAHDFSPHARAALDLAMELARALDGAILLLHVYRPPVEMLSPYELSLSASELRAMREGAERRLEPERKRVEESGVRVEAFVREGSPAETISDVASERGADLVVMGTRGLTGLRHVLLGSVAERTVRIAPCPVLTVKGEEDAEGD
jgi:nucleotide-binding universal stress UspA family protein